MMLRDELDEWTTAAPPWLGRILRSHLEALDLLESHEAEAAAMRAALIEALPLLQQRPAEADADEGAAPSLLSLALGHGPSPTSASAPARQSAVALGVEGIQGALRSSAGNSLLEDFQTLRAQHRQALDLLRALLTWADAASPPVALPPDLTDRAGALLTPLLTPPPPPSLEG